MNSTEMSLESGGENFENFSRFIQSDMIGDRHEFMGPFGERQATYCDFTATGKALNSIEDYIRREVLPCYGNTHSSVTATSEQSTMFFQEARDILRNATRAGELDAVLFVGDGCTSAVHLLVHGLNFSKILSSEKTSDEKLVEKQQKYGSSGKNEIMLKPIVIHGPHEHHSNLLPWREIAQKCLRIGERKDGQIDIEDLEARLKECVTTEMGKMRPIIGCFTAASNITGAIFDVDTVTATLHKYGALAFWDYATAAPYLPIDMNPTDSHLLWKDAIYFSGHKFLGGVQAPGVLIVKKKLIRNVTPLKVGGGTVFFVQRENSHRYLKELEFREEGGTPNIIGAIRLGLAIKLKNSVGVDSILEHNSKLVSYATGRWKNVKNLLLLGPDGPKLAIFAFVIRHEKSGLFLHHNFVAILLDNLFGIQSRAGCMCAGPYAQDLLGIDEELAERFEKALLEDDRLDRHQLRRKLEYSPREMIRPGLVRLNIPYFIEKSKIDLLIDAVTFVAENGWKFLPQYRLNPETGEWHHMDQPVFRHRKWLGHVTFGPRGISVAGHREKNLNNNNNNINIAQCDNETKKISPADYLTEAVNLATKCSEVAKKQDLSDERLLFDACIVNCMRWFLLSSEARYLLLSKNSLYGDKNLDMGDKNSDISDKNLDIGDNSGSYPIVPFKPKLYYFSDHDLAHSSHLYFCENGKISEKNDQKDVGNFNSIGSGEIRNDDDDVYHDYLSNSGIVQLQNGERSSSDFVVEKSNSNCDACQPGCSIYSTDTVKPESRKPDDWNRRIINYADPKLNEASSLVERGFVKWHAPPSHIYKSAVQAIVNLKMIKNGDRILVCLSGGKDSLSLLHILHAYKETMERSGILSFELGAVTVDPGSAAYDPSPLIDYCKSLNITYLYERQDILAQALSLAKCQSICAFCSRMKRGRLYAAAKFADFNVLAFGQHLDDLVESLFIAAFQNGNLRTMKANYTTKDGSIRVIRPLVYIREKHLREFAESRKLPIIPENCPACFESPKERHRIKQLLAGQEVLFPRLFNSLKSAIEPLLMVSSTDTAEMRLQGARNVLLMTDDDCDKNDKEKLCDLPENTPYRL